MLRIANSNSTLVVITLISALVITVSHMTLIDSVKISPYRNEAFCQNSLQLKSIENAITTYHLPITKISPLDIDVFASSRPIITKPLGYDRNWIYDKTGVGISTTPKLRPFYYGISLLKIHSEMQVHYPLGRDFIWVLTCFEQMRSKEQTVIIKISRKYL